MTMETTGAHGRADHDRAVDHDANYSDAHASALEKVFIWLFWAVAAAFIVFTMGVYFTGFLRTDPQLEQEPQAIRAPPVATVPLLD